MSESSRDDQTKRPESDATQKNPPAPGATVSPQKPGMTPYRSTVPGHVGEPVGPAGSTLRPLTQYGTAEAIMHVYTRKPESEVEPADFEQADAAFEEIRKADPAALPPIRPSQLEIAAPDSPAALPDKAPAPASGS